MGVLFGHFIIGCILRLNRPPYQSYSSFITQKVILAPNPSRFIRWGIVAAHCFQLSHSASFSSGIHQPQGGFESLPCEVFSIGVFISDIIQLREAEMTFVVTSH